MEEAEQRQRPFGGIIHGAPLYRTSSEPMFVDCIIRSNLIGHISFLSSLTIRKYSTLHLKWNPNIRELYY
jgi:hypothetical protein